jgi:hypothetical protein
LLFICRVNSQLEKQHSVDTINYIIDTYKHKDNSHKANLGSIDNNNSSNDFLFPYGNIIIITIIFMSYIYFAYSFVLSP